jgi:hypothetical protein
MKPATIEVQINELVLHGFPSHQRHAIADAVQREFTELLVRQHSVAAVTTARELDSISAKPFSISAEASTSATGKAIARAVYQSIFP